MESGGEGGAEAPALHELSPKRARSQAQAEDLIKVRRANGMVEKVATITDGRFAVARPLAPPVAILRQSSPAGGAGMRQTRGGAVTTGTAADQRPVIFSKASG